MSYPFVTLPGMAALPDPIRFPTGEASRVGYARVSTSDQSLASQVDALRDARCGIVFTDHAASGTTTSRPGLDAALGHLRAGDVFTVVRLDRLGRTTKYLITTVEQFEADEVQFASLTEGIDTTTPAGRMTFTVLCAVAQMERDLITERTRAGLDAARARGRKGGRRPSLTTRQVEQVHRMRHEQNAVLEEIAETFSVSRSTVIRALRPTPTA